MPENLCKLASNYKFMFFSILRQRFWEVVSYLFSPAGAMWVIVEPIIWSFGDEWIKREIRIIGYIALILIGITISIFKVLSLVKTEIEIENRKIVIKFGNIFDSKATYKTIPISRHIFETEVFPNSLHYQFIKKFENSEEFQEKIEKMVSPISTEFEISDRHKDSEILNRRYKLGKTIPISYCNQKFLLFSLTETETQSEREPIPDDNCTITKLWTALSEFWKNASQITNGSSIAIPLIGHNVNGINLSPMKTLEINILAILYALKTGDLRMNVNHYIEIVIYNSKNSSLVQKIDLQRVKEIWKDN
jgi:hypothetical protein